MNIKEAIRKVVNKEDLTEQEAYLVFGGIMNNEVTPVQIGAFLTALRVKGETVDEITGAARIMREKASKLRAGREAVDIDEEEVGPDLETILDTCGTGGSGINAFNISTAVAFVVAGCGVKVAKHGNRAASSQCGSADVLEELGVKLEVPNGISDRCLREINIAFLYAPLYHGAMKYAAGPRKEIGVRTIFNILGPLSNPASATCQVLGVYERALVRPISEVLNRLGTKRAFVVHGEDGLDEVTITGNTLVGEVSHGRVKKPYDISPRTFGLKKASLEDIRGGSAENNARIIQDVLSGSEKGPKRDIVLMNASVALVAAGKARDFKRGVRLAAESMDSGMASRKLKELIKVTNA